MGMLLVMAHPHSGCRYTLVDDMVISYGGHQATTLRGATADHFMADVEDDGAQAVVARSTCNCKDENEGTAKNHSRNTRACRQQLTREGFRLPIADQSPIDLRDGWRDSELFSILPPTGNGRCPETVLSLSRQGFIPRSGAAGDWRAGRGRWCAWGRHLGLVQGSVGEADPPGRRAVEAGAALAVPTAVVACGVSSVALVLFGEQ